VGVGVAVIVAGIVGVAMAAMAPADAARAVARPDLRVAAGTMAVSGARRVTGSFAVANGGGRVAGRSTAALIVGTGKARVVAKRFVVSALKVGGRRSYKITVALPRRVATGVLLLRVCADDRHRLRERSEANNCRRVGTTGVRRKPGSGTTTGTSTAPGPTTTTTTPGGGGSGGWVAPEPLAYNKGQALYHAGPQGDYWAYVPASYSDATPATLLVWLHGCGGRSQNDVAVVSQAGSKNYITIAPGGREGGCWNGDDAATALAAIADAQRHFDVDPHRVLIGGFSSGGDLAYRTALANPGTFAGVLAVNCLPPAASGAGAAFKPHVVHLAHTEDEAYNITDVRRETDALAAAGYPLSRIERPGHHWDGGDAGTLNDIMTLLLPHVDDGWRAP
jgi:dienelactone hydrolase